MIDRRSTFHLLVAAFGVGLLLADAAPAGNPVQPRITDVVSPEVANIWHDPRFERQFAESFIAATDIEPTLTSTERADMIEVAKLLNSEKEQKLREPGKKELKLIRDGKQAEADKLRKAREAEADRIKEEYAQTAEKKLIDMQGEQVSPMIDFTLGNIYFGTDRLDLALEAYRTAVQKKDNYRRAWQNVGLIYMRQQKYEQALPAMTRVIELGGGDAMIYGLTGYAYTKTNDPLAGESAYRMAILLDPGKINWKMGLVQCLFQQARFHDVVAMCRTLIADDPGNVKLWMLQANAYIGLQQPLNAAENYEVADRLGGSTASSLTNLGDIYVNAEIYDLAVNAYIRALSMDEQPNPARALRAATVLSARGAHQDLADLLEQIVSLCGDKLTDGHRKEVLKLRARLAVARGAGEEEARVLRQIVEIDPLDGDALILLGQYHARIYAGLASKSALAQAELKDRVAATATALEALKIAEETEAAKVAEAETAAKAARDAEAEADRTFKAASEADSKEFAQAEFYFGRAEGLEEFEPDALVRHAQLLVTAREYTKAVELLKRAQTLKPRDNIQKYMDQIERVASR